MFRPISVFIGLRYTRAKRRNHFISFISLMSMLGIALGVMVLITVLSVMNGFDREIQKRVFSLWPPITAESWTGALIDWQAMSGQMLKNPDIQAVAPFVGGQVLLTHDGIVQPAMINGIDPSLEKKISQLAEKMIQGKLDQLHAGQFGIILGEELANHLDASVGDKITVVTTDVSLTPAGIIPRYKRFTVIGIFRAGGGFGFDGSLGFIHLQDAQKLLALGSAVTGLHMTIKDKNVYAAPHIAEKINITLGPMIRMTDWTSQFGAYFQAVKMEKTMMFFILMLIVAVAVFNLVSTLVMVVNDKESDIAILRTMGATPKMIMSIFVVQGAIIGVTGTLLGVIFGLALALNVTSVVNGIEHLFHVQFLSSSVYFLDYLPSHVETADVLRISIVALLLSLLATLYPAFRAAKTEPVEALRYE